jgi:branched-chain amino acid transport system permease protein
MAVGRKNVLVWLAIGVALSLPYLIGSNYYLSILIMIGIWIILASSLNLVVGYGGQVSMCHAAFYGIGAYASALLTIKAKLPIYLAMPAAGLISGAVGLAVGAACNGLSGHYLAIGTLVFGAIVSAVFGRWDLLTYPPGEGAIVRSIPRPDPISFLPDTPASLGHYYYLVLAITGAALVVIYRIVHSRFGRELVAIREDELLAESAGIPTARCKTRAFAIAAIFAGIAGSLYAHYARNITPGAFVFLDSFYMVVAIVLGGAGTISGPILGAVFIRLLHEILRVKAPLPWVPDLMTLLFGVILIAVIVFAPSGLVGLGETVVLRQPWMGHLARRLWGSGGWRRAPAAHQAAQRGTSRTAASWLRSVLDRDPEMGGR